MKRAYVPRVFCACCMVLAIFIMTLHAGALRVHASGGYKVDLSPTSGAVGTQVTASITAPITAETTFILSATATAPSAGGCASARPLPGVGPVQVGTQGGGTTFAWPASLGQGAYWICASQADGKGQVVYSPQPFTVLAPGAPTPTPTAPTTYTTVTLVDAPAAGLLPGATVRVHVQGWSSSAGTPPKYVDFALDDVCSGNVIDASLCSKGTRNATFSIESAPAAGEYVLAVTVPTPIAPGPYHIKIGGDAGSVTSTTSLTVLPPVMVLRAPTPAPASTGASPSPVAMLVALPPVVPLAALLLVLVVVALVSVLVRRNRKVPARSRR